MKGIRGSKTVLGSVNEIIYLYVRLNISCLPVIILVRIWEWLLTRSLHDLPVQVAVFEGLGMITDLTTSWFLALLFFLPFLLVARLSRRLAIILFLVLASLFTILQISLVRFFLTTLIPLDQVILSYSFQEIMFIARSSTEVGFWTWIPFVAALTVLFCTQYLTRNIRIPRKLAFLIILLFLFSPVYLILIHPAQKSHAGDMEYFIQANKSGYFLRKVLLAVSQPSQNVVELNEAIRNYHQNNPEFTYTGSHYPLLHKEELKDVLSPWFSMKDEPPNLVFLIVESLSPTFCGPDPEAGPLMPFLDSLIRHSLYWENVISASERTFYVLPALFGSLPFSNGIFLERVSRIPPHYSLISLLRQAGYSVSFFYGGDPSFNNMDQFLRREGTHFIQNGFPAEYHRTEINHSGYSWGYPDGDLYRRSFEIIDSTSGSAPRLDIYLTLSLHAPFLVPDQQQYKEQLAKLISQHNTEEKEPEDKHTSDDLLSAILYTDDALREFFQEYRKRPEYSNTIFVITGDHALPELSLTHRTPLEKFHVPLIIFSPMLKGPALFESVSTHLDVTPSILALLARRYDIPTPEMTHWLGVGLDTAVTFRNTKTIALILNNKEIVNYLRGDYFFSSGRLFRVEQDLKLRRIEDAGITAQLEQELKDYLAVTQAIGVDCEMVPEMFYFGSGMKRERLLPKDSLSFTGEVNSWDYVSLLRNLPFSRNYRYLDIGIGISLLTEEPSDSLQLPGIVVEVKDSNQRVFLWDMIPLAQQKSSFPDSAGWTRQLIRKQVDVSFIDTLQGKFLKIYLWNQHRIPVRYHNLNREINGYYEP